MGLPRFPLPPFRPRLNLLPPLPRFLSFLTTMMTMKLSTSKLTVLSALALMFVVPTHAVVCVTDGCTRTNGIEWRYAKIHKKHAFVCDSYPKCYYSEATRKAQKKAYYNAAEEDASSTGSIPSDRRRMVNLRSPALKRLSNATRRCAGSI